MGSKPLPARPQWYKDMIAGLRANRKTGKIPPHEFLELAADEIEKRPDYMRSLARADASAYDKAVSREQRVQFDDEVATAQAMGIIKQSLFPQEVLAELGLDAQLVVGYDRKVETADASHDDRMKAIAELERSKESWSKSKDREIAAVKALDELAGDKTLREILDDRPDGYGHGAGGQ
jgi:hypothetical protein